MIKEGLELIGDFIVDQLVKAIEEEGHTTTGELQNSLKSTVQQSGNGFEIVITGRDYAKYVDRGIPKGAKVSVTALIKWVHDKGIATGEKEVKNLAFAIRGKILNEGSVVWREKRKGFIEVMLDANANIIFQMVFDLFTREVAISLRNTVRKQRRIFQTAG